MTLPLSQQFAHLRNSLKGRQLFVMGTDTDVGKTIFTWQFVLYLQECGEKVVIFKPVECGGDGDRDTDFYATHIKDAQCVGMYSYNRPVSPHIEARRVGTPIDRTAIATEFQKLKTQCDWVIVEGAGGVYCPLADDLFLIDIAEDIDIPVIVVASNRVGCLNHTLLSVEALRMRHIEVAGVVLNGEGNTDNIRELPRLVHTPLLAVLPQITTI